MTNLNPDARQDALAQRDTFQVKPTSLISYQSSGRVIVFTDESGWMQCARLQEPLHPFGVLSSVTQHKLQTTASIVPLASRSIEISGHLGDFKVKLTDKLGQAEILHGDILLDLGAEPLVESDMPPPGYLYAGGEPMDFPSIQQQLQDMVGQFEKPKYFSLDPSLCAHSVNGKTVCTNCIDACPAGAISSIGDAIQVDSHLCQGGGSCSTVCPSGAIRYEFPSLSDQGNRIRKMLRSYRLQGRGSPIVVFHSDAEMETELLARSPIILPLQVEEIASVGMELCLSTLSYGAAQVVLLAHRDEQGLAIDKLQHQLLWLHALMGGLGIESKRISLLYDVEQIDDTVLEWPFEAAEYSMPENKRQALYQALDHLYQQAQQPGEEIALPAGAPFGTATIDADSCTLCMACVGACPGKALQDGSNREVPEVFFIESQCLQCGACTTTCPEQAISVSARMIYDREIRNRSRRLHQDTPFACISCGKPFAPTSVIHNMTAKLKDHYMFKGDRAMNRLKMCEDCRVADIVQDPDAMNGNFDPIKSNSVKRLP